MVPEHLAPARVFYYFKKLSAIPHGSGNTKAISDYCVSVAEELGLDCRQDGLNNVVIYKKGSPGREAEPPVILQGHLDMVCEKEPECDIDFSKDGLRLKVEGDLLSAEGTTLGGDDGIAVAMALAILEDNTLSHPPLEALFTVDEETGMYGAAGLQADWLQGRRLLNIDSEEEGVLTVGCAGGARADISLPLIPTALTHPCYRIVLDGLAGGHSGVEIHKGRHTANKLMGEFWPRWARSISLPLQADRRTTSFPPAVRPPSVLPPIPPPPPRPLPRRTAMRPMQALRSPSPLMRRRWATTAFPPPWR